MILTDVLISEHTHIEHFIDILFTAVDRYEQGQELQPYFFLTAAQFIRVYADGIHHSKEEGILFPVINPAMGKAVEALLGEHEIARGFTRGMMQAALAWQNGDEAAAQETVKNARNYAALLHDHILHENGVVFPATSWLISPSELARMDEQCANVRPEGVDVDQILTLLDTLDTQMNSMHG